MSNGWTFPQKSSCRPMIYAYEDKAYPKALKIGYTEQDVETRVKQQYGTKRPDTPYKIVFSAPAMRRDSSIFRDHDLHRYLKKKKFKNPDGEWFECSLKDVKAAYIAVRDRVENEESRSADFGLRPEQEAAVQRTMAYFKERHRKTPHFLWNAKMRFGKTFAAYSLAKRMGWKRILVLTFKPAVQNAWEEDLKSHVDFEGWQFVVRGGSLAFEDADKKKPIVCFGSFQDFLGKNSAGGIKARNEWVHETKWDCVILDEYHFGSWRENAKGILGVEDGENAVESEDEAVEQAEERKIMKLYDEAIMPIKTGAYLYLSGTPFRAIASGEFIEEQIYNWTYSDEQRAKENWNDKDGENPYAALPRVVMLTYHLPEAIRHIAMGGEYNQFDLNEFFKAEGTGKSAKFKYATEVQKWLDLIRGAFAETTVDNLKLGAQKPALPFSDIRLLELLPHTFWFLPNVASCQAMANLLQAKQNTFYHDYKVIVAAGNGAGMGVHALPPVFEAMDNPQESKTITLSCGKLATGVSVPQWSGIFMLRNCKSPETYFQAAFRVQTPWVTPEKEILKRECYIFDFAPDRALRQISEYSNRLNIDESSPEKRVEEFIHFLPVLAYDGSAMKQINAAEVLDYAMSGTSATLLAKRWESALLVNVDNATLAKILANKAAMDAIMKIVGFRSLNADIQTIINKSGVVQKLKKEANDHSLTQKEKRELTEAEKEYKGKREQIQKKLIKFATRIPIFMYLTDFREETLKDVITKIEVGLFKKVTGLEVQDFELLVSLNLFNDALMNDAVYKFKRYEDASLNYTGVNKHGLDERVGLWGTTLTTEEYQKGVG